MDISAAFLKGMTFKEIASETGDTLRSVQFDFLRVDVWILRKLPGMEAMWGLKDAPRAFGMRLG
eukprot:2568097-Prorocentrum_lima.AAC.1